MAGIHQLVAGYSKGDAISNEARVIRGIFQSWGFESEIYCETKRILPELRKETRGIETAAATLTPDDIAVLHLSIGSPVNEVFKNLRCRRAIIYHNITPPPFFRGLNEEIRLQLERGLAQARSLAGIADVTMAVSKFNAGELEAMGHRDVKLMPLFLHPEQWEGAADRRTLGETKDGLRNILFVGRCAPNKRIEDLLSAFHFFQKYVEPNSRLIHVGSWAGIERYYALLRAKTIDLKLKNVVFAGSVPPAALRAYYQSASALLCLSEHEGFCIPLLESFAHSVPVLAYAAAAIPETMDGAGILVREKNYDAIAEMLGRICTDSTLRASIITAQRARLDRYFAQNLPDLLRSHLAPILPH